MNGKRIIILTGSFIILALVIWYDLPIEFPGAIFKILMLFVKLSVIAVVTIFAYMFAGGKKKPS